MSDGPVLDTLRIESVADVADAVREYVLVRPDGAALPAFEPGAHVTVRVPDGTLRRYSLCGDPSERARWRIAVRREDAGRGGSRSLHERARAGDPIEVSAVHGHGTGDLPWWGLTPLEKRRAPNGARRRIRVPGRAKPQ